MFSFTSSSYDVIARNVRHGEMIKKYPDRYMIAMNGHVEDEEIHGDIVAILTKEDYIMLEKPKNLAPKFSIWKGIALRMEEVNNRLGFII